MNEIVIEPINNTCFGATVTGIALPAITSEQFETVHRAFLIYGFLVFPKQHLTDDENIKFAARFGELEFGALPIANRKKLKDGRYGQMLDVSAQRMRTNIGNETWHTDSTYRPVSSKCAMLSAVQIPQSGGETQLADMRAGYETLDEETKTLANQLSAYHSTQFSQANDIGDFPLPDDGIYHGEAYLRPLVKVHPETGVPNLFVGRHAFGIPGLDREASRTLLRKLVDSIVSEPERVYTHHWQVGDTLLWDNRALLHRARPYDYEEPRVMTATRVAGDTVSELSYYPEDPLAEAGRQALSNELAILRSESDNTRFGGTTAAEY
ncbi:MAG: alpha-ketoglutarate-dependent 2,4-dichlorophenoxyacetate dioxygenase [Candidatus Azotimanducaceae bacterium]|jgi:alpha-ketoglutarate-dependent 2,4-dichlorophenoxyacetate dioxygenase